MPAFSDRLLYHGTRRWSAPLDFADLVDSAPGGSGAFDAYTPKFIYWLYDLTNVSDAAIRDTALAAATRINMWLLKHV